jgi:hypothetical protein
MAPMANSASMPAPDRSIICPQISMYALSGRPPAPSCHELDRETKDEIMTRSGSNRCLLPFLSCVILSTERKGATCGRTAEALP